MFKLSLPETKGMTKKEQIKYYIDTSIKNCIEYNDSVNEEIKTITDEDEDKYFIINYYKKCIILSNIEILFYNCIKKNAPEIILNKIIEKIDVITCELMEQLEEGIKQDIIEEGDYLNDCNRFKLIREQHIKLIKWNKIENN